MVAQTNAKTSDRRSWTLRQIQRLPDMRQLHQASDAWQSAIYIPIGPSRRALTLFTLQTAISLEADGVAKS